MSKGLSFKSKSSKQLEGPCFQDQVIDVLSLIPLIYFSLLVCFTTIDVCNTCLV